MQPHRERRELQWEKIDLNTIIHFKKWGMFDWFTTKRISFTFAGYSVVNLFNGNGIIQWYIQYCFKALHVADGWYNIHYNPQYGSELKNFTASCLLDCIISCVSSWHFGERLACPDWKWLIHWHPNEWLDQGSETKINPGLLMGLPSHRGGVNLMSQESTIFKRKNTFLFPGWTYFCHTKCSNSSMSHNW